MVQMVDISQKPLTSRVARASGFIRLKRETLKKVVKGEIPKGDVFAVAQTAAIMAIKDVPKPIPLAHPISITGADVKFKVRKEGIGVMVEVKSVGKTGVEMEALVGVAGALLTIWDMVKALEKDKAGQYPTTSIEKIRVLKKVKG
ncbi:MAG TPA: cyclic pyranopterin monophosphate synthase MoaC [Hadesarchaea archaeon]|nr:cyclic pyranopterin monophosphate synthase MoaC [Hadesarchaea archaeon]